MKALKLLKLRLIIALIRPRIRPYGADMYLRTRRGKLQLVIQPPREECADQFLAALPRHGLFSDLLVFRFFHLRPKKEQKEF